MKLLLKKVFLSRLRNELCDAFEKKGFEPREVGDNCGKDRQSIERLLNDEEEYCPSIYYTYEVCEGNDIDFAELINRVIGKGKDA